eukprot:m.340916 g.340916  ORF g.340916 m.340916 type:complete len:280 (+) comp19829_c1_seq21:1439-2278(+)
MLAGKCGWRRCSMFLVFTNALGSLQSCENGYTYNTLGVVSVFACIFILFFKPNVAWFENVYAFVICAVLLENPPAASPFFGVLKQRGAGGYILYLLVVPSLPSSSFFYHSWTLIASTKGGTLAQNLTAYYTNEAVLPGQNALLEPYFTQDITTMGTELLVVNAVGQKHVFKFADFAGPLIFDGDNTIAAGKTRFEGIVYGNAKPYADKFQVGATCDSSTCHRGAATQPADKDYTPGMMVVFDWESSDSDASAKPFQHAQLGGTAAMGAFAVPLTRMYIR